MDLHYNAFISYRHHPQDIKVAETIHRSLERFKVPKALKQQGKSIDRIFRDKEELPITSSLTDTITMALRNSDYQIVICSTHLKDSYWVQREIETFLQTHTKDKVLTVLVDGDNPYDVIPEILTYNEVIDPVTGEVTREPIEPLSCDWRMSKRKAMKTELPRLAAVLLGCTYDDLIQRQKQYRQRRLIAGISTGMAASLALAGYFLYTGIQIQENLNQSLRNQSQYLASAAQELYSNGDRLTALALALEALPENNDRPYVPAAELALTDALMLYDAEGSLISVASFDAESSIDDFILSDDGTIIYVLDSQKTVTVWNTTSYEKLSTFHIGSAESAMLTDNDGNLLVVGGIPENSLRGDTLLCYSPKGQLLWERAGCRNIALSADKSCLYAIETVPGISWDHPDQFHLLQIDPKNGSLLAEPYTICDGNTLHSPTFTTNTYYNGQPITVSGYTDDGHILLASYPATGETQTLLTFDTLLRSSSVTEDGLLYAIIAENNDTSNVRMSNYYSYTQEVNLLYCFDLARGKEQWCTAITSYNSSEANTIVPIPNTDRLFCQCASAFLQLDAKTGKILEECHSTNIPLTVKMNEGSAWVLFSNGCSGTYSFGNNTISYMQYMDNGLTMGANNNGIYVVPQLTSTVLLYRYTADSVYTEFSGEYEDYVGQLLVHDQYLATLTSDSLQLFDISSRKLLWKIEGGYGYSILDFSPDGSTLYLNYRTNILQVDTATGEAVQWELPYIADNYTTYSHVSHVNHRITGSTLCSLVYSYDAPDPYLSVCDLETKTYTLYPFLTPEELEVWADKDNTPFFRYADENILLIQSPFERVYRFNRTTGTAEVILTDLPTNAIFHVQQDADRIIFNSSEGVRMTDMTGSVVTDIPLRELSAVSFCLRDGELLVLGSDGKIHRYDETGSLLSSTVLSVYSTFFNSINNLSSQRVPISWAFTPDGELIINALRMGNIINTEHWARTGDVSALLFYDTATDSFICQSNGIIYAYERASLEEMQARTQEELHSFTLSEAQRAHYGLN